MSPAAERAVVAYIASICIISLTVITMNVPSRHIRSSIYIYTKKRSDQAFNPQPPRHSTLVYTHTVTLSYKFLFSNFSS
jgi:hypothetical protein